MKVKIRGQEYEVLSVTDSTLILKSRVQIGHTTKVKLETGVFDIAAFEFKNQTTILRGKLWQAEVSTTKENS